MKRPSDVAELLDEIIRRADPFSVARRGMIAMMKQTKLDSVPYGVLTTEDRVEFKYYVPTDIAMKGVEGTPEEVLEWLSTGLNENQRASLEDSEWLGRTFVLTQIHHDAQLVKDLDEMTLRVFADLAQRQSMEAIRREEIEAMEGDSAH